MSAFAESILITALLNAILAMGLYVTVRSGQLSVAHAALAGVGGYLAAILTTNLDLPLVVGVLAAIAIGGALGVLIAVFIKRMSALVGSLASLAIGQAIAIVAFNADFVGSANGFQGIQSLTTLPIVVAAFLVTLWIASRYERSRFGIAAQAASDDLTAAATSGIDVLRIRMIAFGLGGGIAGLAGSLTAHYALVIVPGDLAFAASFAVLIFVLFGGSQTVFGAVMGALLLTALPQVIRFTIELRFVLYGLLVATIMLLRPEGLITPAMVRRMTRALRRAADRAFGSRRAKTEP
jgi:branched-chain amino acid transport system permease protein